MTKVDTGTDELLCEIKDRVALITLNRPQARNALSDHLTPALRIQIKECGQDPAVGALLITGAGNAFCAGGDIKGMGSGARSKERTSAEAVAELQTRQRTLTGALAAVRKPTIAALPGPAAGAGLAIALACDIRLAADSAFVVAGYGAIALSGDYGISWGLTRAVGTARARELMFTNARLDAETCARIGLVNRVIPAGDLRAEAFDLARDLASGPTEAYALMKDNLDHALEHGLLSTLDLEAENMVRAVATSDHKEAVAAFIEKRKPNFVK